MQRGERIVMTATLSSIFIIAMTFFVLSYDTTTGSVVDSRAFINSAQHTACDRAYCTGYQPAYYLGHQGMFAECCCPENYKGNGHCMQPQLLGP